MEKETKLVLATAGTSFVVGVATTLTILSLCCPLKHDAMRHFEAPRPEMSRMHDAFAHGDKKGDFMRHHDMFARGQHRFGDARFHPNMEMKEKFAKKLKLTDEQKEQIEKFRTEDREKMRPLMEQMEQLRQEADSLRQANRERFESILNDEQKEILKKMHEKHFGKMKSKHLSKKHDVAKEEVNS